MSIVSSVVLCFSDYTESVPVKEVQQWLTAHGFDHLRRSDHCSGGNKAMQMYVYCGAFNYFGGIEDDFGAFVGGRSWELPRNVVLLIQPEDFDSKPLKIFRPGVKNG